MSLVDLPKLVTVLLLFHCPTHSIAFGWWFQWPTTTASTVSTVTTSSIVSQSANGLEISLGNRENTNAGFEEGGTNISNVEVNYARTLPEEYAQYFASLQDGYDESRAIPDTAFSPDNWIDTILDAYYHAANESRLDRMTEFTERLRDLESYADDVASMLDRIRIAFGIELNRNLLTLDVAVLRCARAQALDAIVRRVFEGNRDCIEERLELVRIAQLEASRNISQQLVEWDETYLRSEIARCSEGESGLDKAYNEFQLACISGILHQVHLKTLLMSHNAQHLTEGANAAFGTAKANLLQCAEHLVDLAKDSLGNISRVAADCQRLAIDEQPDIIQQTAMN